jgi:hypothetical protein
MKNSDLYDILGECRFVTVISTDVVCGKVAKLTDGKMTFTAKGSIVSGVARIAYVPTAESLHTLLAGLTSRQYLTPDFVPALLDCEQFVVVAEAIYKQATGNTTGVPVTLPGAEMPIVTLNSTQGCWAFGAWRVLDRDVDASTPEPLRCAYEPWLGKVEQLLPGLAAAPRVFWPSSKTRVVVTGAQPGQSLNGHTWVDCSNGATDIVNEIRSRLYILASNAGLSWPEPRCSRTTGEILPGKGKSKAVFDIAIWTIHRCIYAGAPTVGAGLELLPPAGQFVEGTPLDLNKAVPELTSQAVRKFAAVNKVVVERRVRGGYSFIDRETMSLISELELEGETLTVAEFLRSDKYAFDEKVRCQSMFRQSSSWNGIVRKYENGQVMHHDNGTQTTYWLACPDWRLVCERFMASPRDSLAKRLLADGLAGLSKLDWTLNRREIAALCGGLAMASVDALREAGSASAPDAAEREQVRQAYQDERVAKRRNKAARDIATLHDGEEILEELLAHWHLNLTTTKTDAITFFNERSTLGHGNILRFGQYALPALRDFCAAYPVDVGDEEESPIDVWQQNSNRSGVSKITFEPGFPRLYDGAFNLWTGFAVAPIHDRGAGCKCFIDHVLEVIASGSEEVAEYIFNWLAARVQGIANRGAHEPLKRMVVALVLRSIQGTGKGLFELYIAAIFGTNHSLVTSRGHGLASRFNWEFANLVLLCADEAFFVGDKGAHDVLKSFQTEPLFTFEQKFKDVVSLPNHCATLMSTNKDWAVPADAGERRMCVLDVSDCRKGDSAYFAALVAEKDGTGPGALLGWLLDRDISDFKIEAFPRSEALQQQQIATMSRDCVVAEWLHEALETGRCYLSTETSFASERIAPLEWSKHGDFSIGRHALGEAVRDYANKTRKYSPPSNDQIGRDLKRLIGHSGSSKIYDNLCQKQQNAWKLPPLQVARDRFDEYLRFGSWKTEYRF